MALDWDPANGSWVLNGFGMITPAMKPMNLELLQTSAPLDIANVHLSGVDGDLEREAFEIGVTHQIRMQMAGDVTHAGGATASPAAGVAANYRAVAAALHKSTWGGKSCSTTVGCADGVALGGQVQVQVGPLGPDSGVVVQFVIGVTIPKGFLAVMA